MANTTVQFITSPGLKLHASIFEHHSDSYAEHGAFNLCAEEVNRSGTYTFVASGALEGLYQLYVTESGTQVGIKHAFVNLFDNSQVYDAYDEPVIGKSGVIDVNIVSVSGVPSEVSDEFINVDVREVSGVPVRIEDFHAPPTGITSAVWNVNRTEHSGVGTFGEGTRIVNHYADGAVWINTNNGGAGTRLYENGTSEKPVNNIADALTIASGLGIKRLRVHSDSTITLTEALDEFEILGDKGWTLVLGGQSLNQSYVGGARIRGLCSGFITFEGCTVLSNGVSHYDGGITLRDSVMGGTIATSGTGIHKFSNICESVGTPAGNASAKIALASSSAQTLDIHSYHGRLSILDMNVSTSNIRLDGVGRLTIDSSVTNGSIDINGQWDVTDNGNATTTIYRQETDVHEVSGVPVTIEDFHAPVSGISSAVWDVNRSDHNNAGTFGEYVKADVVRFSGDATTAANIRFTYDGTGYLNGNAPSTQNQVGRIASTGGGAISFDASGDNTSNDIKGVAFLGVQTNTFESTSELDGVRHTIDDVANSIDIVYAFNVGENRVAVTTIFDGFLNGGNDELDVFAYDFVNADWDQVGILSGKAGSNNDSETYELLNRHTGTAGDDAGEVYIRFQTSGQSNPSLHIDRLWTSAVNSSSGIAANVWDELRSHHSGVGTFGEYVNANITHVSGIPAEVDAELYFADIQYVKDANNARDEYSVCWFKNSQILPSADVSDPAMTVFNTSDGSKYITNQTLDFVGTDGILRHDSSVLIPSGESLLAVVSGVIDSESRSWKKLMGLSLIE